jgi:CRP/FNR family cyclic AMP-dependent transcriptional regulator
MEPSPIDVVQSRLQKDVIAYGEVQIFPKGSALFYPEEMRKKFFFVLEGRIKVYQVNLENGKEQTLKILTHGDMYDVVSLLDNKPHDNLLSALEDSKVIIFPIEVVQRWMKEDKNFNKLIFPYIAEQLRGMEELAVDLSFYDTFQRLLKLLSKNIDHNDPTKLQLINDLSHDELASLIGTVRKVLNRHLQQLKDDGVIDVKRKNIELKDTQKLLDNLPFS